jgi:hypothetical protein
MFLLRTDNIAGNCPRRGMTRGAWVVDGDGIACKDAKRKYFKNRRGNKEQGERFVSVRKDW